MQFTVPLTNALSSIACKHFFWILLHSNFIWAQSFSGSISPLTPVDQSNNSQIMQYIMRFSKATDMLSFMNLNVNPCQNFYTFACGNWAKINPANSAETIYTGLFENMNKAMNNKIERMLKTSLDSEDTEVDRKVKDFYESCCRSKDLPRELYRRQLLEIMDEFGGMPAIQGKNWKADEFDWLDVVARIAHKYGNEIIIGLDIIPDFVVNTANRIYIGHPEFPLESKSMYLENVTRIYRMAYQEKIEKELFDHLGLSRPMARDVSLEILDFEIELAKGMADQRLGLGLDQLSELTTIANMQKKYAPILDIQKLVQRSLNELVDRPVYEFRKEYQENLLGVVKKKSKQDFANYIMYRLLDDFLLVVEASQKKQDKVCIEMTRKHFTKNLDNMIYRRFNNDDTERDIRLIWTELKKAFKTQLHSNDLRWITNTTREQAIEKLDSMKLEISSYANENFSAEFGKLVIDRKNYVENIKNILQVHSRQKIAKLHEKPKPFEAAELFSYTPANIILENTVKVPVSLLQPHYLWAANYPNALKFGTLGTLIGHEIVHGFDDNGRKYDKHGNYANWWDIQSVNAFKARTNCFADQYSRYFYSDRFLPRMEAQSENIADNGAVRLAYASYLKWQEGRRENKSLLQETMPLMNFTSKQLFFISYAQVWCNDIHPRMRDLQTSMDTHMPGMFRVIGPLSNYAEFAREFNCSKGSHMHPNEICEIY